MPIYEYQCESCEQRTEAIQRLDEPPLTICPHCGGPLVKLMSAPSFQFKGSGWYVTDYAGKGDGTKKESKSQSDSASTASGGDKGDSGSAGASSGSGSSSDTSGKSGSDSSSTS